MLSDFIDQKLGQAKYQLLKDKTYYGEIPSLRGVWSNAKTLEACRKELKEVLEDWLVLQLRNRNSIPGFRVTTRISTTKRYDKARVLA